MVKQTIHYFHDLVLKEYAQGKTFILFAGIKLFAKGFQFLIPLGLAKLLSPSGFGSYSLSMMIVYFFISLLIRACMAPFNIYGNEEMKNTGVIRKSFTVSLIQFMLSCLLFFLFVGFFSSAISTFASISGNQVFFMLFAFLGLGIQRFVALIFLAQGRRIMNAIVEFLSSLITIIFLVLIFIFYHVSIEMVFLTFFCGSVSAGILTLWKIKKKIMFPLTLRLDHFSKMFHYARWVMLGGTAVYFINWGDNLVLRHYVSLDEIGVYNLGYQMFKGLIILFSIIPSYFTSFMAQHIEDKKKVHSFLYQKRPKILLFSGLLIIFAGVIIPLFITSFYDETYKNAALVFIILVPSAFIALYRNFYLSLFAAMKRVKFMQLSSVFFVILNISLDIIFVSKMGILGAAVGTLITYITIGITFEYYFQKHVKKGVV